MAEDGSIAKIVLRGTRRLGGRVRLRAARRRAETGRPREMEHDAPTFEQFANQARDEHLGSTSVSGCDGLTRSSESRVPCDSTSPLDRPAASCSSPAHHADMSIWRRGVHV